MKTTTNWACTVLMAAALLAPPILTGQVQYTVGPSEDFSRGLFTPELIMRHYREIGLSTEQRSTITEAIRILQSVVVDPQWSLMEVSQNLTELLEATPIDEAQALSVIDQVFAAEAEIKRANMSALIRIKNALTQEQHSLAGVVVTGASCSRSPRIVLPGRSRRSRVRPLARFTGGTAGSRALSSVDFRHSPKASDWNAAETCCSGCSETPFLRYWLRFSLQRSRRSC